MMTTVTIVTIQSGQETGWDAAFRERIAAVKQQPGWIAVELCVPVDAANRRVVIGTWDNRAAWEAWHATPAFRQTRAQMQGMESAPRQEWWHEVILRDHR